MIEKTTMYKAVCDRCGKELSEQCETVYSETYDLAVESALDNDWCEINGRLLCDECYHYDSNKDENVENEDDDYYEIFGDE